MIDLFTCCKNRFLGRCPLQRFQARSTEAAKICRSVDVWEENTRAALRHQPDYMATATLTLHMQDSMLIVGLK